MGSQFPVGIRKTTRAIPAGLRIDSWEPVPYSDCEHRKKNALAVREVTVGQIRWWITQNLRADTAIFPA